MNTIEAKDSQATRSVASEPSEAPVRSSDGFGAWWEIPHPGTLEKVKCATFTEAMDKWFEGFNIPLLVVDGVREDFSKACDRVRRYYAAPNAQAEPRREDAR